MTRDEIIKAAEKLATAHEDYGKCSDYGDEQIYHEEASDLIRSLIALVPKEGMVVVPEEPTEEQWGGLARDIMMWVDMNTRKTPRSLLEHLTHAGRLAPQWLLDEPEMKHLDHSMSKGTRCVIIYKAILKATKEKP